MYEVKWNIYLTNIVRVDIDHLPESEQRIPDTREII